MMVPKNLRMDHVIMTIYKHSLLVWHSKANTWYCLSVQNLTTL